MRKIIILIALASPVALPLPAIASRGASVPMVRVGYSRLDLSSREGLAKLDARLEGAVHSVCTTTEPQTLLTITAAQRCRSLARRSVAEQRGRALALAATRPSPN